MCTGSCLSACLSDCPQRPGAPWETSIKVDKPGVRGFAEAAGPPRTGCHLKPVSSYPRVVQAGGVGSGATPHLGTAGLPACPVPPAHTEAGPSGQGPRRGQRAWSVPWARVALCGHSMCVPGGRGPGATPSAGTCGRNCWRRGAIWAARRPHGICLQP